MNGHRLVSLRRGGVQNPAYRPGDTIRPARGCPPRAGLQFFGYPYLLARRLQPGIVCAGEYVRGELAMTELPDYLVSGDEARLIPVGASSQRERFACSVLLASLRVVRPFARAFFAHMNLRAGSSSEVSGYTEPVFKYQTDGVSCRPDGLLILDTGRRQHRLIVERKSGRQKSIVTNSPNTLDWRRRMRSTRSLRCPIS